MKVEKLLLDILLVQSPSYQEGRMIEFIKRHCKKKGYNVTVDKDNVYVTKGGGMNFPCYVAHTDTCAKMLPNDEFQIVSFDDNILAGYNPKKDDFTQVGFDDKIGIFIALKMLDKADYGKAFFPHAEEVGCIGTSKADMEFFKDCGYLIQCDRRNAEHMVDNVYGVDLMGSDFKELLTNEGGKMNRKFTNGMLTDVYKLKTMGLEVACSNFECGYYNPHRDDDYCELDQVYSTLDLVGNIYTASFGERFEHKYETKYPKYYGGDYGRRGSYNDWDYPWWGLDDVGPIKNTGYGSKSNCDVCNEYAYLKEHHYTGMMLCKKCEDVYDGYFSPYGGY